MRRVLRKHGTLWLNLGDATGAGKFGECPSEAFAKIDAMIEQSRAECVAETARLEELSGRTNHVRICS
jgi:hypothetical protein